jgi:hypothetical protein
VRADDIPNPDNQPENRSKPRLQLLLLSRTGIAIGVTLLIGLAGVPGGCRLYPKQASTSSSGQSY